MIFSFTRKQCLAGKVCFAVTSRYWEFCYSQASRNDSLSVVLPFKMGPFPLSAPRVLGRGSVTKRRDCEGAWEDIGLGFCFKPKWLK